MTSSPMTRAEHRSLAKRIDALEAELVFIHEALRSSQRTAARTRLDASKALTAVRAFRLSMAEQLHAETIDHAREAYFR